MAELADAEAELADLPELADTRADLEEPADDDADLEELADAEADFEELAEAEADLAFENAELLALSAAIQAFAKSALDILLELLAELEEDFELWELEADLELLELDDDLAPLVAKLLPLAEAPLALALLVAWADACDVALAILACAWCT